MLFNDIKDAVIYLINSTVRKEIPYSCNYMLRVENFLTNFIHNPQVRNEESFDFGDGTVFQTIREDVMEMDLYDFDQKIYCCISFGNINDDDVFGVEADFYNIINGQINNDVEAKALVDEYYDSSTLASRKDEIIKIFKNLTIVY